MQFVNELARSPQRKFTMVRIFTSKDEGVPLQLLKLYIYNMIICILYIFMFSIKSMDVFVSL